MVWARVRGGDRVWDRDKAGAGAGMLDMCDKRLHRRKFGTLVAVCTISVVVMACSKQLGEATFVQEREPEVAEADPIDCAALAELFKGVYVFADTVVSIERAGKTIMLRDERRVAQDRNGDFLTSVRRIHAGSEAGDSNESLGSIKVGRKYWTKGNAGPWVSWDDAIDEPEASVRQAMSATADVMRIVAKCGTVQGDDDKRSVSLKTADCQVEAPHDGASWTGSVAALDGDLRFKQGMLIGANLKIRMRMFAGGNESVVSIAHDFLAKGLPDEHKPKAPSEEISSRRERPAWMVKTVLEGFEDSFKGGAPKTIQ